MKTRGSVGGLILILVGIIWLMINFGIINWSLSYVLFKLWPLILVVIGINIIFRSKKYIGYITWGIFFIIIIVYGFYSQNTFKGNMELNKNPNFILENRPEIISGKLNLKVIGGNIRLDSIDDRLINAQLPDSTITRDVNFSNDNTKVNIDIKQKEDFINFNSKKDYDYNFSLNENVLWDIDIDTGAFNGTFDFSNLKISKLDIDMGASNLNLIFGDKQDHSIVDIDGGISNLEITIPENLGVKIDFEGGIKNTNINNLGWKKSGSYYISPNYDSAEKKLELDVDTGIGKFDVIVK